MKNNSKAAAKRTQVVYSEPRKIKIGSKIVKGVEINIYKRNKNAKPIKTVLHPLPPPTGVSTNGEIRSWGLGVEEISDYKKARNAKRDADRLAAKNRPVLVVSGSRPFKGSIRTKFTGANRNNIV